MATTAFSGQYGWGVSGEPSQTLQLSDGFKTLVPYQVFADTDTIDGGSGVMTIPATGIYHIKGNVQPQNPPTPGILQSQLLANGSTVIASGYNANSTGSNYATAIVLYAGCLEAGTTIELQGFNPGASANVVSGQLSILRVPVPFSQVELSFGDADQFIEWQPICDIPAWWDIGTPTRITVPSTGYYFLSVKDEWSGFFTGDWWRISQVYVNGSYVGEAAGYAGPGLTNDVNYPLSTVLQLTAGDYVEIMNDVESGATAGLDVLTSADLMMFQFPGTFCGAHLYKSGQVANGTFADVTFNTSVYDTDGFWAGGTSAFLTVPSGKAGKYIVWGNDLKAGLRAVESQIVSSTAATVDPIDYVISGVDSTALANYGSSPHMAIWDLAVGDQIHMQIRNFDTGGTQSDLNMGLALIDGWTYPRQRGCPCPKPWLPQIYRRLARATMVSAPAEFVSGLGSVRNFNTGTNYTSETISVPSIMIADGESIFVSAGGNSATVNGWACSDNLGNTYTIEKGPTADLGYSIFGPQLVGTLFAAIPSITGVLTSITITWTDALGGDGTRIMLAARFRNIGAQEASTQEDNIGGSYTTANGVLTQAGSADGIGISCYVQRTAGGPPGVTFSAPADAAIATPGIGVGADNSAISVGMGYSQPVTSTGIVANNAGDPSRSYLHIGKAYSAA